MELIDDMDFSDEQKRIVQLRVQGASYEDISRRYKAEISSSHETLSRDALCTCLVRSALSKRWEKGMSGGNENYLCKADFIQLKEKNPKWSS